MTTIIMVHGVGGTAEAWSRLAPAFREQGWKVETPTLRPDQRKADNPPADLPKLRLKDYVDDVEALAREVEKTEGVAPVLFGHSMGGLIVQKVLERGAGRAGVLLTPASPVGASAGGSAAQLFTFANVLFGGGPARSHKIWRTGFSWGVLNQVPKAKHAGIYAGTVYDSGAVYADLGNPDKDESRTGVVDETKIKVPVLTIGGAKDRATPIANVRLVGAKYGKVGGDYREYPNHAHWIVDEPGTDKVIADIAEWLASKGIAAGAPAKAAPVKAPAGAAKAPAKKVAAPAKAKAAPKASPEPKAAAVAKAAPAAKAKTAPKPKPAPAARTPAVKAAPAAAEKAAPTRTAAKPSATPKAKTAKAPAKPAAKAVAAKTSRTAPAAPPKTPPKPRPAAAAKPPAKPKAEPAPAPSKPAAKAAPKAKAAVRKAKSS